MDIEIDPTINIGSIDPLPPPTKKGEGVSIVDFAGEVTNGCQLKFRAGRLKAPPATSCFLYDMKPQHRKRKKKAFQNLG